jgi:hypothetical protein
VSLRGALTALVCALPLPAAAVAQDLPPGPTVYLMTFGPGRAVWERFGHNAIWIHDPADGTDQAYNYGLFDFAQEHFLLRFIRGQMWYWMAGFPAGRYVGQYERDNRSVWVQELDVSPDAARELQQFLRWNELPEHRFYHYDYYRDNCSTRVRDALDRVLGGAIHTATAGRPTGTTYRFHTQRLTANDPLIATGLLLAGGQGVDRPISEWEEMFLPLALREHLRAVTVRGPGGASVPLVRSERTLFESSAPPPPASPPSWLLWYLALGGVTGAAALALARPARQHTAARFGFLVIVLGWAAVIGLAGLVLAGLWGFTDHVMAYRNENLLQASPLALLLLPLAVGAVRGGRRARLACLVAVALAALSVLGLVAKLLPGFDQANAPVIALALPAHLGIAAAFRRLR